MVPIRDLLDEIVSALRNQSAMSFRVARTLSKTKLLIGPPERNQSNARQIITNVNTICHCLEV